MVRLDRNARRLTADEQNLAYSVFKDSLPGWWRIHLCDGLGLYDRPYTLEDWPMYLLHVGPTAYADMSHGYRDLLIHELTHVWQYYHDYDVIIPSAWAQLRKGADAYTYNLQSTNCWNDFNVEQQAKIVEHWFVAGLSTADLRYPFIEMIIRPGIDHSSLELDKTSGKAFVYAPLEDLRRSLMSRSGS